MVTFSTSTLSATMTCTSTLSATTKMSPIRYSGVLCLLTPSSQAKSVSQRLVIRIPDDRVRKRRAVTLRCSFRMEWGRRRLLFILQY
ncbi:hypothetical protein TNCV_3503531 [Trichonephila clavipes]|uniref:Uncharacterized protein n=1 Tax=Trichonephila clavipes TaxID=2585209 RepID=A0A8X6S416_TRICX|nr:hypothetical protein TNCV_3503531 [Trichonephila clavipes]